MSQELISHNNDLKRLRDDGYEVQISNNFLIISHVPYVNNNQEVLFGTLVSRLELSGNSTVKPNDHVALWAGEYPCDNQGNQLVNLVNSSNPETIREGFVTTHTFSQKPFNGYDDYYQKMTHYAHILEGHARKIDPVVTAQTYALITSSEDESVFYYLDTATSRSGITDVNEKLKKDKIAIIGLGGTGSYILDLVAKTPVGEIHLFDGDRFLQHNAFRSPGAPSSDELQRNLTKAEWFTEIYSKMRRNIISHSQFVTNTNISELDSMDIVFICIDNGESREMIVNHLLKNNITFIDVGMGLCNTNNALTGLVRITTSTPSNNNHVSQRIPFGNDIDNEYSTNIQIADMNALNAVFAVIKWKKLCGFYSDIPNEHHTVYGISTNTVTNDEIQNET